MYDKNKSGLTGPTGPNPDNPGAYIHPTSPWALAASQGEAPGCGYDPCGYRLADAPATPTTFDVGDIVYLASGSPPLTVVAACDECGEVDVAWFNGAELEEATFLDVVLVAEE